MCEIPGQARDLSEIDLLRRRCELAAAQEAADAVLAEQDSAELRILRGRIALDRIAVPAALAEFDRALEHDPESDHAHAWHIAALARDYQYTEALEFAEAAVTRFPESAPVRVAFGRLLLGMERPDDALRTLEEAFAITPDDVGVNEWRCVARHVAGDPAGAEAELREALIRLPDEPDLLETLAYLETEQLRYEAALLTVDRALKADPWHEDAHERKLTLLRDLNRFEQAEEAAAEALSRLPKSTVLIIKYALIAGWQGQYESAVERAAQAVAVEPDSSYTVSWYAMELRIADRFDEAEAVLEAALARSPESPRLLLELAWLRDAQNREDDALDLARTAARLDPYRERARSVEVDLLRGAGRPEAAEEAARDALRRFPADPGLRLALVEALRDRNRFEDALRECTGFLDDIPFDVDLIVARCGLLAALDRYEEQLATATAAQQRFPEAPELHYLVGRILLARSDFDAALPWMQSTLERSPGHAEALEAQAMIYRLTGRFERAAQASRAGLRILPSAPELHEELFLARLGQGRHDTADASIREAFEVCGETWYLRRRAIREYVRWGRYEDALREVDRALELKPGNLAALLEHYEVLMEMRRFDEAEAVLTGLTEEHGDDGDVLFKLGWWNLLLGRFDPAVENFRRARDADGSMVAMLSGATALRFANRFDEAIALLREELVGDPDSTLLLLGLSRVLRRAGRFDEALRVARRVKRLEPHSRAARQEEIHALRRSHAVEAAEEAALAAVEKFPYDLELLNLLGEIYGSTNRLGSALSCFDKILAIEPFRTGVAVNKAAALRTQRRYDEAERFVREVLRQFPHDSGLLTELGRILLAHQRFSEAERHFSALLDRARTPFERNEALFGLGWVALRGNDLSRAQRHFRDALELDPRDDDVRLSLAAVLLRSPGTAQYDEVERLCLGVLEDDRCDDEAHALLGVLNFRRGNHAAAEHHLRTAIELNPYDGAHVDLAALHSQLGRFDEAEKLLEQAVERDWYDVQAHVELGNVYLQRDIDGGAPGEWAGRATQQFRQAIVLAPGNGTAAIGLARSVVRSSGDLVNAEEPLRYALDRSDCDLPKWRLQVELARLLVQRGDATGSEDLYPEALAVAREAIGSASDQAEPYFVAGIAEYKIAENGDVQFSSLHFRRAARYLSRVERFDSRHSEAHRVRLLAQQRIRRVRSSAVGSVALITVSLVMLASLWVAFFLRYQVPTLLLGTLTPVLVAMVAIGFLLPLLVRLKLPGGLEADLSASLNQVSSGPVGEVSLGSGRSGGRWNEQSRPASLSEGPRGELSGRS